LSGCTTLQSATNKQVKTNTNTRHAEVKKTVLPSRWAKQLKTTQAQSVSSLIQLIQLPHLRTLVNSAINQNPGLQRTLLASKSADLTLRRNKASSLPIVSADFGGSRAKQQTGNTASSYNSGLNVSWELDLWKKLADKEQGAAYDKVASDHDYQAARASLAANVMKSYLNLIASQQELAIEQRRSKLLKNNQEVITERYRSGLGSLSDLETARSSSAKAMASLVHIFNPEMIIIGGKVALAEDYLINTIQNTLNKYTISHIKKDTEVVTSGLQDRVKLLGSVAMVMNQVFDDTLDEMTFL
jgi:hypothetical protein